MCPGSEIEEYIVAREHHSNGDLHLHVYLKLKEPIDRENPRFADFTWADTVFHGNY